MTVPNKSNKRDIVALGIIIMKLMQKYTKDERIIDENDTNRWPMNSHAVEFLFVIISAVSISELLKISLCMIIQQMSLTLLESFKQNPLEAWKSRIARFL